MLKMIVNKEIIFLSVKRLLVKHLLDWLPLFMKVKMSIRKKLLIIPLLFIVLISIISYIYYDQTSSSRQLFNKIYDENFVAVIDITDANSDIISAQSIAKELSIMAMLGEDPVVIVSHSEDGKSKISNARSLTKKYSIEKVKLDNAFDAYIKTYDKITKSCAEDLDAYSASLLYPDLDKSFVIIASIINNEVKAQKMSVKESYGSIVKKSKNDSTWFYSISVLTVLLSVALVLIISKLILSRIYNITDMLRNIAEGDGDLTKRVDAHDNDELGVLAKLFNKFIESIHSIISELALSADQLVSATEKMTSLSQKTNDSMHSQMIKVEHVSTAMNQMTDTVCEVSRNIVEAASNADIAEAETKKGQTSFLAAIEIINALSDNVRKASEVIARLKQDSTSIGGILDVIRGIAEQTNLLALNAAIEAARAGEQGRGFAVVADEVRTLATRTQQSTEEIQTMIESLQNASEQAAAVMEHGIDLSEKCEEKTYGATENINIASSAIVSMSETNTQVATAAEEQSAVAEEININITDINSLSQETSNIANNVAASGQELAQLSNNLRSIINRYKY